MIFDRAIMGKNQLYIRNEDKYDKFFFMEL